MALSKSAVSAANLETKYNATVTAANGSEANQQAMYAAYETAKDIGAVTVTSDMSDAQVSAATLGAVNITVDESTTYNATFSFGSVDKSATLDNKNIVATDALKETNTMSSPDGKFKSSTNPIYEEDSAPSTFASTTAVSMHAVSETDTTAVTSALYQQVQASTTGQQLTGMSKYVIQEEDSYSYTCGG